MNRCSWLVIAAMVGCSEYEFNDQFEPPGPGEELPGDDPNDGTDETDPDDDPIEPAEARVYANTSTALYEVDPATGGHTYIGEFSEGGTPVESFVDIAIDMEGRVYGGTFDALYRIDPFTADVTLICSASHDMTAMTFSADGELFIGGSYSIYVMNVEDCTTSPLVTGAIYETSGDLVGLPDGYLYWTVYGWDGDELVRVHPESGATTWVGPISERKLYGLGYAEEQLFGFSSEGKIVRISPLGASSSVMVDNEELSWWGATTNPVTW